MRRAKRYRRVSARVRDLEILGYLRASASRRAECESLRVELGEERGASRRGSGEGGAARRGARARANAGLSLRAAARRAAFAGPAPVASELAQNRSAIRGRAGAARSARTAIHAERRKTPRASTKSERRSPPRSRSWKSALLRSGKRSRTSRERELAAQAALAQAARKSRYHLYASCAKSRCGAAEVAARKAERRAQAESLRTEAERLECEERAARERAEALEIAAGGAAHRHAERRHAARVARRRAARRARARRGCRARGGACAGRSDAARSSVARDHSVELRAAESRLHTIEELENSLEGHVPGTRAIVEAWQRGELRGIEGIVSNLITTDERYARALGRRVRRAAFQRRNDHLRGRRARRRFSQSEGSRPGDLSAARHARAIAKGASSTRKSPACPA